MFIYGEKEIAHLCAQDARLGWAIGRIGYIERETEDDIFASIVGQYRQRYSPYATVAGFYLWAIASGALPELCDPAVKA